MADGDAPMPGPNEFSADEEKAMRTQNAQFRITNYGRIVGSGGQWQITPKGIAVGHGSPTPALGE